jgi:cell division transport system permease protein
MSSFRFYFREGAAVFIRPTAATFASLATIAAMLLLASVIAAGMYNIKGFLDTAEERAQVVVYVSDATSADSEALKILGAAIRSLPQVASETLITKEAAWNRFNAMYGKEMLSAVDINPLPVSFEISLKPVSETPSAAAGALKREIMTLGGIESVRYSGDWLNFLARCRRYFLVGAIALTSVLFIALFTTIANAVQLTATSRSGDIRAMQLVGATRFSIVMPFIIEGMLQGLAGGVMGEGGFCLIKGFFHYESSLRQISILWGPPLLPVLFLLLGVVFGWIGSLFAARRFPA